MSVSNRLPGLFGHCDIWRKRDLHDGKPKHKRTFSGTRRNFSQIRSFLRGLAVKIFVTQELGGYNNIYKNIISECYQSPPPDIGKECSLNKCFNINKINH